MKILHVINDLDPGGAERILYKVVTNSKNDHYIVSLQKGGLLLKNFKSINIKCYELEINGVIKFYKSIIKFKNIIKKIDPDITQTWLYKSDLIGGLLSYFFGYKQIYWNIRNNKAYLLRTKLIIFILSILSYYIPKKIILCSNSAIITHKKYGYDFNKFHLIVNGYDFKKYVTKNNNKKDKILKIANISRYNLIKNHHFLFKLVQHIKFKTNIKIKLYLYGNGLDNNNKKINSLLKKYEILNEVVLKGFVENISTELHLIDIHVLSSLSESFPNVVAETMLNKIPNISVSAGDAKNIISNTGWVIDDHDIIKFSDAIKDAYTERFNNQSKWLKRKLSCQSRIKKNYSLKNMIQNYDNLWNITYIKKSFLNFPYYYNFTTPIDLSDLTIVIPSVGRHTLLENIKILNSNINRPKKIIVSLPYYLKNNIRLPKFKNVYIIFNRKYDQISQRSAGFKLVKTKYVMQLDEDTLIYPFHINLLLNNLKKLNNTKSLISPVYYNVLNGKALHNYNYFYFNFLNNIIFYYFFGSKWGEKKYGTIAKSGINFGICPTISKNLIKVDWIPGACIIHYTKNINKNFIYNYKSKAYGEDIINSYLFRKKNIKMFIDTNSFSYSEKAYIPFNKSEFDKFLDVFLFYNKLFNNNNSLYFKVYYYFLKFRKFIKL